MSKRTCSADGCSGEHIARGLCARHYRVWRERGRPMPECTVAGCDRPVYVKGLCRGHYARQQRGRPVESPLAHFDRGTVVLVCRLPAAAMQQLRVQAAAEGTTGNRLGARLILETLATMGRQGSSA